jgi:hypothetical protein
MAIFSSIYGSYTRREVLKDGKFIKAWVRTATVPENLLPVHCIEMDKGARVCLRSSQYADPDFRSGWKYMRNGINSDASGLPFSE